ncbi:hypothetical protein [Pontiella sp.]|uniref:hypothetical protein n=1 Tax=Pontiella sp. TaxID=2837462 RepID=UPI0035651803
MPEPAPDIRGCPFFCFPLTAMFYSSALKGEIRNMAHLSGHCECGRPIHFPKTATYGYRWECYRCGRSYVLSNEGDPLHRTRSRRPPESTTSFAPCAGFVWRPWMTKGVLLLVVYAVFGRTGLVLLIGGWIWLKSNGDI